MHFPIISSNDWSNLQWFTSDISPRFKSIFQPVLFPPNISLNSARIPHTTSTEMHEILWPFHVRIVWILFCNRIPKRTQACEIYKPKCVGGCGREHRIAEQVDWTDKGWVLTVTQTLEYLPVNTNFPLERDLLVIPSPYFRSVTVLMRNESRN